MASTFIFGWLELKMTFCEIPFPKSIVYSAVVMDKLPQNNKSFFPTINVKR